MANVARLVRRGRARAAPRADPPVAAASARASTSELEEWIAARTARASRSCTPIAWGSSRCGSCSASATCRGHRSPPHLPRGRAAPRRRAVALAAVGLQALALHAGARRSAPCRPDVSPTYRRSSSSRPPLGGAINSVAGGGSFVAFPALLFAGVAPVPANATNTIALWPGSVASAVGLPPRAPRRAARAPPSRRRELWPGARRVRCCCSARRTAPSSCSSRGSLLFATVLFSFGGRADAQASAGRARAARRGASVAQLVDQRLRRLLRRRDGHHDARGPVAARHDATSTG